MPAKDACYVLVRTSTEAFDLYGRIRDAGVPARVAPAPHGMQACCGTSVMLEPADVERARAVIDEAPYPIERIVRVAGAVDPLAISSVKGVSPSMLRRPHRFLG